MNYICTNEFKYKWSLHCFCKIACYMLLYLVHASGKQMLVKICWLVDKENHF